MLKLIIGVKGTGKTKALISMVNEAVEKSSGAVICIEKGDKLRFDVKYQARLIDTDEYYVDDAQSLFGFVAGKMETWRPWKFDENPLTSDVWFHDLYNADHTPYCPEEIAYIKRILTGENACNPIPLKTKTKPRKVGKYF